jgi:hypothetical protein
MSLTVDQIPDVDQAPPGADGTTALTRLPAVGTRRTLLRAALLGAVTIGTLVLTWSRRARAESSATGLQGWDRNDCRDAYPTGYDEVGDTSGSYVNAYAACFGGSWRGSTYCEAGWHKHGTWTYGTVTADFVPINVMCGSYGTKNAWKWTTPDGHTYRCSDGMTTYWGGPYNGQTYYTICRSSV